LVLKIEIDLRILQGSVISQTVLGGLAIILQLQIFYTVHNVQKITKISWT